MADMWQVLCLPGIFQAGDEAIDITQFRGVESCIIWRFPKMGVPPVTIHLIFGFSTIFFVSPSVSWPVGLQDHQFSHIMASSCGAQSE